MPGWDWWRTYPYSSYNAWRNPYWYYPYTPYVVYPYYYQGVPVVEPVYARVPPAMPANTYTPGYSAEMIQPAGTANGQQLGMPHPTGELRAAPPDAGALRLQLPAGQRHGHLQRHRQLRHRPDAQLRDAAAATGPEENLSGGRHLQPQRPAGDDAAERRSCPRPDKHGRFHPVTQGD